jgi:hypothetical protein
MSTTMTLLQLRTALRQRTDTENSTFFSDAELNSYLNQSYFELYDILVQKFGDNYYVQTPYTITTDGTNDQYSLPSDFYKLLGVDLALSNSLDSFVTIQPFNFSDRNKYAVPNFQSFYGVTNLRYRLNGSQIWFTPIPASGQTVKVWYVPKMTTLTSDTDTVDGVSGWTEYIIVDAAIKVMQKQQDDPSVFLNQKAGLLQRIESAAENRDAGSPATVADTQYSDFWWPSGSGSGYSGGN